MMNYLINRSLKIIVMVLMFASSSFAAEEVAKAVEAPAVRGTEAVRHFVDVEAKRLISIIDSQKDKDATIKGIRTIIAENFYIDWMAKFVLGKQYKQLSDAQKASFPNIYLDYLVHNYYPILIKHDSKDSYVITKVRQINEADFEVEIKVHSKKTPDPINLKYRVRHLGSGDCRFIDMLVEGVSTIFSQRSEFSTIMQQGGYDELVSRLKDYSKSSNPKDPALRNIG